MCKLGHGLTKQSDSPAMSGDHVSIKLLLFSIRTAASGENNISPNKAVNSVESSGIMILAKWLKTFPDDFRLQPVMKVILWRCYVMLGLLQDEVNHLIGQLRKCRGPRMLHAHQLKNLLHDIKVHIVISYCHYL